MQASAEVHDAFQQQPDRVLHYASSLLSMDLTIQAFQDAVREGDEDRVVSLWKLFVILSILWQDLSELH